MTDEDINDLILTMKIHRYEFESAGPDTVGFWTPFEGDNRHYKAFSNWNEVFEYCLRIS